MSVYLFLSFEAITNLTDFKRNNCLIIEEKWRELTPKRGTLVETNLFEKYQKLEKIEENSENTKLTKFIKTINKTEYEQVVMLLDGGKHEKIMPNYLIH